MASDISKGQPNTPGETAQKYPALQELHRIFGKENVWIDGDDYVFSNNIKALCSLDPQDLQGFYKDFAEEVHMYITDIETSDQSVLMRIEKSELDDESSLSALQEINSYRKFSTSALDEEPNVSSSKTTANLNPGKLWLESIFGEENIEERELEPTKRVYVIKHNGLEHLGFTDKEKHTRIVVQTLKETLNFSGIESESGAVVTPDIKASESAIYLLKNPFDSPSFERSRTGYTVDVFKEKANDLEAQQRAKESLKGYKPPLQKNRARIIAEHLTGWKMTNTPDRYLFGKLSKLLQSTVDRLTGWKTTSMPNGYLRTINPVPNAELKKERLLKLLKLNEASVRTVKTKAGDQLYLAFKPQDLIDAAKHNVYYTQKQPKDDISRKTIEGAGQRIKTIMGEDSLKIATTPTESPIR